MATFVQLWIEGKVTEDRIDDFIERHRSGDPKPLQEFLGFSKDEYTQWVKSPSSLSSILNKKEIRKM